MNPESPSLSAKILAATFGFVLLAAVPLLAGYYVAKLHTENAESPAMVADHR